MDTVLIFTGGGSPGPSLLADMPSSDLVVAADSGYDLAVEWGVKVDVLVGDMDSISASDLPSHVIVDRHPVDKDATDLELAMRRVAEESPQRVVVIGGSGGRIDHEIATVGLLASEDWSDIAEIDWVNQRGWGYVVRGRRRLHGDVGDVISLVPMGGDALGVETRGLKWNLAGATLRHGTTRGVSNEFVSPVADIKVNVGCVLALVPRPSLRDRPGLLD